MSTTHLALPTTRDFATDYNFRRTKRGYSQSIAVVEAFKILLAKLLRTPDVLPGLWYL